MFDGESKKRPTVSLRGKIKEEDRTEFIRRARAQRQERARERLHASCATTIQKFWRGRSCVAKWREQERGAWDKKMHDVGRVKTMLAAAGKVFQIPSAVLGTLLSQLVSFHVYPQDAGRFRDALALVNTAPPVDGQQHTSSFFAPLAEARSRRDRTSEHRWTLLISRLGALCLQYVSDGATTAVAGAVPSLRSSRDGSKSIGAEDASAMDVVDTDGNEGENTVQTTVGYTEAVRVLSIITSFEQWGKQGGSGGEATVLCRRLLVSLALGKLVLQADESPGATTSGTKVAVGSGPDRDSQPTKGPVPSAFGNSPSASGVPSGRTRGSVRLLVRASSADVSSGRWMRTPLLFRVLRVHWDAAAMETAAAAGESGESVKAVVRLLCDASLKALGICTADAVSSPAAGAREKGEGELPATLCASEQTSRQSVADIEGVGMAVAAESALARIPYGDQTAVFLRRETLQAFACTVLPSPKLLEHPFRALLVDPMLAGDAQAWWELVAVSGEVVGATDVEMGPCGSGAAGGRGDVAWTVANLLRVDTGTGGTTEGAGSQHARCLVRALCQLLRRVSLHALLKGAGQTASSDSSEVNDATGSGKVSAVQMDDDVEMDDFFTSGAAGAGGATGSANDEVSPSGGGIRLEDIVRFHRRRCALRAATLSPEAPLDPSYPSGSTSGVASSPAHHTTNEAAKAAREEIEAMKAAAGTLADASVVGKLFDTLLPPVAMQQRQQQQQKVSRSSDPSPVGRTTSSPTGDARTEQIIEDNEKEDPVLSLCSLYADLVMDGVRAGPGAASTAATGSGGGGNSAAGDRQTTPAKSVLNALAFGRPRSPIAARLWAYLQGRHNLGAYAESVRGGMAKRGEEQAVVGMQSALFLFCSAYSHQLLALDDEEFYEKQKPLALDGVRQLANFLKTWLCRLYWLDPAMPRLSDDNVPPEPTAALRYCEARLREALLLLAATRLFNQLYERNTRRRFLDAEAWYWEAISAKELTPPDRRDSGSDSRMDIFSSGNLGTVLTNIPQVIPFFQRVIIFRHLIAVERREYQNPPSWTQNSVRIRVNRDTLYEDSADQLNKLGAALKGRVQVTFVNQHGVEEAGIDGGGVFKEYMDLLTKRAFDPQYALFLATEDQYLFPNPSAELVSDEYLFHFEFLGRVLAKAVFEDILVEPLFSPVFLNKLLGKHNYIDDLYSLDPELYRNLMRLKAIVQQGGDVEDLFLTFSATTTAFGETKVWDLIPGGRDVAVTNGTVISYIHLMAHFKLNVQTARPCMAFLRGFRDLIPMEWIGLFNPHELQRLIGGEAGKDVDFDDLQRNTYYAGGYHESQPVMQWFWETVRSFNTEQQGQFLKFVTSCSRPPLLGFERLNPPICVQRVPDGEEGRLPSSATCMNLLKLPQYPDRQTLREKLVYAISANAGFELT